MAEPMEWNVETSQPAKGRLWIKVVEARNLLARSKHSKPYCVVEFEKNEFVTREAVSVEFDTGNNGMDVEVDPEKDGGLSPVWKHEATL
jgi:hypothetical protein